MVYQEWGSNPRGHCPLDLKSNALTTRPSWYRRTVLLSLFLQVIFHRLGALRSAEELPPVSLRSLSPPRSGLPTRASAHCCPQPTAVSRATAAQLCALPERPQRRPASGPANPAFGFEVRGRGKQTQ